MRTLKRLLLLPVTILAMLIPTGAASAAPATVSTFEWEDISFYNACTGDTILVDYTVVIVTGYTPGGYTNHVTLTGTGTSVTDGTEYIVRRTSLTQQTSLGTEFSLRYTLVSQGEAPDQFVIAYYNTATGEQPTSEVICR